MQYLFDSEGKHLKTIADSVVPYGKPVVVKHPLQAFPWPIVLEEGVIVKDESLKAFEGKYYPVKEAEAMIAKRDKKS